MYWCLWLSYPIYPNPFIFFLTFFFFFSWWQPEASWQFFFSGKVCKNVIFSFCLFLVAVCADFYSFLCSFFFGGSWCSKLVTFCQVCKKKVIFLFVVDALMASIPLRICHFRNRLIYIKPDSTCQSFGFHHSQRKIICWYIFGYQWCLHLHEA